MNSAGIGSSLLDFERLRPRPVGFFRKDDRRAMKAAKGWISYEVGWEMVTASLASLSASGLSTMDLLTSVSCWEFAGFYYKMVEDAQKAGEDLVRRWEAAGWVMRIRRRDE